MVRPPASPLGCGLTQRGLVEQWTPRRAGDWPHSIGSGQCSQSYSFKPRLPNREAGLSLSVWSGGVVIVAGRTAGLQGGQRAIQRSASAESILTCRERDRGLGVESGALGTRSGCSAGAGGEGNSQLHPPQACQSLPALSSGPRGGGPALRCAGGGGLGRNLAICLGKHPTSELGW